MYYIGAKLYIYLKGEGFYHFSLTWFILSPLSYLYIPFILSLSMLKRKKRQPTLKNIVRKQTGCSRRHIHVPDPLMDLPSLNDVNLFLRLDKTDELPYMNDTFDCDNFSGALRGKAILYAQSKGENWAFAECESNKYGGHRFNLVAVKPDAIVYYIEPQNDRFFIQPGRFKFIVF